jgi:hypothetical protein
MKVIGADVRIYRLRKISPHHQTRHQRFEAGAS